jgi:hypothetical protein
MLFIAPPGYGGAPRTPIVRCHGHSTLNTVVLGEGVSKSKYTSYFGHHSSGGTAEAPIGPHGVAAASTPACHGHRYMKWPRVPVPVPRREARRVRSRRCFPQAADIAEDAGHVWRCRTSLGSSLSSWLTCSSEEQSCRVHCLGPQQSCRCWRSGR